MFHEDKMFLCYSSSISNLLQLLRHPLCGICNSPVAISFKFIGTSLNLKWVTFKCGSQEYFNWTAVNMIVIFGTLVQNNNMSMPFFSFQIFWYFGQQCGTTGKIVTCWAIISRFGFHFSKIDSLTASDGLVPHLLHMDVSSSN